jgi:hypothetical protein
LHLAFLLISIVAKGSQNVLNTLKVRTGDIVQKKLWWCISIPLPEQSFLNASLLLRQPCQITIEMVLVEGI